MAQAEDPQQFSGVQRKGTGFVPAATPGAAAGVSACRTALPCLCAVRCPPGGLLPVMCAVQGHACAAMHAVMHPLRVR